MEEPNQYKSISEQQLIQNKLLHVGQTLENVQDEKEALVRKFTKSSHQWQEALELLEQRHQELEQTMFDLQDLNGQLTHSNALLLDLKYQADQAQARAVSSNAEKTKFLARMSHEIRSPLSIIVGYTDQILEDIDEVQDCKQVAQRIRSTSDFILEVVNEVLDLSKIEAGAFSLSASQTPLIPLVYEVYHLFEQTAKQKGIGLELDLSYPFPESLYLDGHRLKQVLVNLCSNAIKFTENGAVKLRAWHAEQSVYFEVQDSGIGMTEAQLSRIFQPYTQAEHTITSSFGGTGLGLYIAREIVGQMHGQLSVISEASIGSCFKVRLPVNEAQCSLLYAPEIPLKSAKGQITKAMQTPRLRGRVLVAEDTLDLQIIIAAVLQKSGLETVLVNNGQQALAAYEQGDFDLVILDIEMPLMDGVASLKAIKALEASHGVRTTPILALTAHAFKEEITRLKQEGFDAILTKPFKRAALLQTLAHWFGQPGVKEPV